MRVLILIGRIFIIRLLDWIPAFAGMTKKMGEPLADGFLVKNLKFMVFFRYFLAATDREEIHLGREIYPGESRVEMAKILG